MQLIVLSVIYSVYTHTHTLFKSGLCCSVYSLLSHPPTSPSTPLLPSLPPSLYRCAAGDADTGGEEDLSVPADGGHAVGHPYLPDTTVQTSL